MSDDDTKKWWAEHAGDASVTSTRTHSSTPLRHYDREARRASGWIAMPDGSITRRGFHRHASLERRDALVGMLR
jgi:hypothetical protein